MAKEVIMPALGMAQETGILLQWLKAEGDEVAKGEPLMEIETDKAAVEVEASAGGILANVTANPGDEVPVGQVIALLLAPGEETASPNRAIAETDQPAAAADAPGRAEVLASPVATRIAAEHRIDLTQVSPKGSRIQKEDVLAYIDARDDRPGDGPYRLAPASPKARRLAEEHHLNVADISGSGPGGAVLAADVLAATKTQAAARTETPTPQPAPSSPPPPAAPPQALAVSRMWQVMAQRLTQSWTTVPHFYLTKAVNAGQLIAWREQVQQRLAEKVTVTDLLVKVVAAALRRHPRLHAQWQDNDIVLSDDINVGLAVAVEEGLLVPVIPRADRLGLAEIAAKRQALVSAAQAGKLTPAEMSGGRFTVSNLGMFGIDAFNAIVNPPEAGILAFGQIADQVVAVDGQPLVRPMMTMTLTCDHRVVDGARGAQFLQTLAQFIEDPLAVLD